MIGDTPAATAVSTYLLGDIINQAYVHRNFKGIVAMHSDSALTLAREIGSRGIRHSPSTRT